MINVSNLHKKFGKVTAIEDISFNANKGEIFGLLGPNGAGKTTTLRIIYGLFRASSGKVLVDGIDVNEAALTVQKKLGVLPDGGNLYTRLTARENIRYFGQLQGLDKQQLQNNIERYCEILGMENIIDRKTAGFSQGERMKVALARAIVHDPEYILLDEPTNGLDVVTTRAVRNLLLTLKSEGKCVIFSSHLMHEVNNLCDRVGIISAGKLTAEGSIPNIIERANTEQLEDAFIHFAYPNNTTDEQTL
ncbi:MAG: ABC transporter ATP-binding protein [Alteromonadaceae bacterium]|nr:MAG: ABC transporter ATP-binding protein [Alteromonadaceae bacterium]